MTRFVLPYILLAASLLPAAPPARTVPLTGNDTMKYDVTKIDARRGETLRVVLKNTGTMPKLAMAHNFVLLRSGADAAAFSAAAASARATDFIPAAKKGEVVASTGLAGPGESVEVTFTVPSAAGTYPYLCTFTGHYAAGMRGQLVVR